MKKLIYIIALFAVINLNASLLHDSIKNIIGQNKYAVHKFLIFNEFRNEKEFYIGNKLKYKKILKILQDKGILDLKLSKEEDIKIEFSATSNSKKLLKTVKDVLGTLGYAYYFTDFITREDNNISWQIRLKSESMLDPYMFLEELEKLDVFAIDVKKVNNLKWKYKIDLNYAKISNTIVIQNDEKVKLQKPHKAYMLEINGAEFLHILSARLNSWYPRISFYDKNFEVLNIIEKKIKYKDVKVNIPMFTKYILVDDTFTLLNIKRGLTIIVR